MSFPGLFSICFFVFSMWKSCFEFAGKKGRTFALLSKGLWFLLLWIAFCPFNFFTSLHVLSVFVSFSCLEEAFLSLSLSRKSSAPETMSAVVVPEKTTVRTSWRTRGLVCHELSMNNVCVSRLKWREKKESRTRRGLLFQNNCPSTKQTEKIHHESRAKVDSSFCQSRWVLEDWWTLKRLSKKVLRKSRERQVREESCCFCGLLFFTWRFRGFTINCSRVNGSFTLFRLSTAASNS